jgi:hypothetical protein
MRETWRYVDYLVVSFNASGLYGWNNPAFLGTAKTIMMNMANSLGAPGI